MKTVYSFFSLTALFCIFISCNEIRRNKNDSNDINPEMHSLIDDYVERMCMKYNYNDSLFYVTVMFLHEGENRIVKIVGMGDAALLPYQDLTDSEWIERVKNNEDTHQPLYGYFLKEKQQWILVYDFDNDAENYIRQFFPHVVFSHDSLYLQWEDPSILDGSDTWIFKLDSTNHLELEKKIEL